MNTWFVALCVLILLGIGVIGCRKTIGVMITPMLIIVAWWGLWLTVAVADFYAVGNVGAETVSLCLVAMTGVVFGGILPQS